MKNEFKNTLPGAYAMHEEACRKSTGSTRRHYIVWAAALLACAVTLLVYLPALENQFVGFDDVDYVIENRRIRSMDLAFLRWIATAVVASNWHPLTLLSHAMDYGVWGADPFGHHLTSIILHGLNTSLVLILAIRLIGYGSEINGSAYPDKKVLAAALFTALLFGLHPLHVESVAWVSERKDVLCAFFYLLSVLAYLKYASPGGRRPVYYYSSLVLFSTALMSKPMAVSLPAVLLILDYCPLGRLGAGGGLKGAKRVITEKIPFFVLGIFASVTTIWAQKTGGALRTFEILPLADRIAVALRAYAFYIYKMVLPVDLSPFYPYPESTALVSPEYVFYFMVLALVTVMSVLLRKRTKIFTAVWLYYLITLLPVVGIVQVGSQAAADRYTYLPSLGPFILLGLLAAKGFGMRSSRSHRALMVVVTAVVIPALLATLTIAQIAVWKDTVTLWSHQIRLFPMRAPIAYNNLGAAYGEKGMLEMAVHELSAALSLRPDFANAHNNLGLVYSMQGRTEEAVEEYREALRLDPDHPRAHYNLGVVYQALGRTDEAIVEYTEALRLKPDYEKAHNNLGEALYTKGLYYKAVEEYKKAIAYRPGFAEAHNNLGTAYGRMGLMDMAIEEFLTALRFGQDMAEIHFNLGLAYEQKGLRKEAIREIERVLEISPDYANALKFLESLYSR